MLTALLVSTCETTARGCQSACQRSLGHWHCASALFLRGGLLKPETGRHANFRDRHSAETGTEDLTEPLLFNLGGSAAFLAGAARMDRVWRTSSWAEQVNNPTMLMQAIYRDRK